MKKRSVLLGAGAVVAAGLVVAASSRCRAVDFSRKIVLITGSSRGFGLALAEQFGRAGARLVLVARDPEELARAQKILVAKIARLSDNDVLTIPCDLTDPQQGEAMIAIATERFGRIDILLNNAGVISVGPVEDQPLSAFKEAMESNYYTTLHSTFAVLPQMLARRSGNIVNITSIGGKVAVPHLLPYSASKFAAAGFSQGLNAELRSKGIKVTTVCPGLMRTGSHIHAQFTGDRQREYQWFSLGASLPGVSISAKAAARKVVSATARGASEIAITPQALFAARCAQVVPACTAWLLGRVNDLLPKATRQSALPTPGIDVNQKELKPLTTLGEEAVHRFNEQSGPAAVS